MVVCIAPERPVHEQQVACEICGGAAELAAACSGAIDGTGRQTFACTEHLLEPARRTRWVTAWADLAGRTCAEQTA